MSCKHIGPAGQLWGQWWSYQDGFVYADEPATETRCLWCGDPAPMAANDTPEVLVEIRAAEIASDPSGQKLHLEGQWLGWLAHRYDTTDEYQPPGFDAGYLARCIVEHDKEQS